MMDLRAMQQRVTPEGPWTSYARSGAAQNAVGDRDASAETWQDAADTASEIGEAEARAEALTLIATSRLDWRTASSSAATLQQAARKRRLIKDPASVEIASAPPGGR